MYEDRLRSPFEIFSIALSLRIDCDVVYLQNNTLILRQYVTRKIHIIQTNLSQRYFWYETKTLPIYSN
jgi:hypothetical protein